MIRVRNHTALIIAASTMLAACGAILGLPEPALDDSIGKADSGTGGASSASSTTSALSSTTSSSSSASASSAGGGGGKGAPVLLYNGRVRSVFLDDTYVYWNEDLDEHVGRMKKDGTDQVYLATGDAAGFDTGSLAVDDTAVYWSGDLSDIRMCPKIGCGNNPVVLLDAKAGYEPVGLHVDAQFIYFSNYIDETHFSLNKMPIGGGAVAELTAPDKLCPSAEESLLASGFLYLTCENGEVAKVSTSDGTVEQLLAPPGPRYEGIVLAGTTLFFGEFAEAGSIVSLPASGVGGTAKPIALNQAYTNGMTSDAEYLYWLTIGVALDNGGGSLVRCSIPNCNATLTILAKEQDIPQHVVTDATDVYWSNWGNGMTANSGIWRLAK